MFFRLDSEQNLASDSPPLDCPETAFEDFQNFSHGLLDDFAKIASSLTTALTRT
jgi:hypothetical protein